MIKYLPKSFLTFGIENENPQNISQNKSSVQNQNFIGFLAR
jgi:hypothetical protein